MEKQRAGFKYGKNPTRALEDIGTVEHAGRRYRVLRVEADGKPYISLRLYNSHNRFIKQFMLEPEIASQIGSLFGNSDLEKALEEAKEKANQALSNYKFMMFGYWAAIWVHLNRIGKYRKPNPWRNLVKFKEALIKQNQQK